MAHHNKGGRLESELIYFTPNPIEVISRAAGTSYGKNDVSIKRAERCFKSHHLSVFEHVFFTTRISGISRACSHQLVRHRMASFVQQSQRYTRVNTDQEWYVTPPMISIEPNLRRIYDKQMLSQKKMYHKLLSSGVLPEDARYVLPESTMTTITMTMNAREFFHFLDLRDNKSAQWEIQTLALHLIRDLSSANEGWKTLIQWHKEFGSEES